MVRFGKDKIFFYLMRICVVEAFRRFCVPSGPCRFSRGFEVREVIVLPGLVGLRTQTWNPFSRPCRICRGFEVREVIVLPELIGPRAQTGNSELRVRRNGQRSEIKWPRLRESSLNFDAFCIFIGITFDIFGIGGI